MPSSANRIWRSKAGAAQPAHGFLRRTLMSRPHVTQVSRTEAGRNREMDNRGNRSGRERSSPTWGGCRGDTGWRKSVDLVHGYEIPPLEFHLLRNQNKSSNLIGLHAIQ